MATFEIDAEAVRTLAALITETGLTEIEYQDGERRVRVARQVPQAQASVPAPAVPTAVATASAASADEVPAGAVTSPMVGTTYLQSEPGAPPFVRVGDSVREGDTLLIIEAMKVMNQIPAPHAGIVREIRVTDGTPVEYGEILMVVA